MTFAGGSLRAIPRGILSRHGPWPLIAGMSVVGGVLFAVLLAGDNSIFALVLLLVIPGFVLLHRYPLGAVALWLILGPYVVTVEGGGVGRRAYWLVHRAIPVLAIVITLVGARIRTHGWRLHRLGVAELFMLGYLVVSQLSILYMSGDALDATYRLYDRVFVPMCLYLLVRILAPDRKDFGKALPAVAFLLLSQILFGVLQWVAPEVLPGPWLGRAGERTTGSLQRPGVYSITLLATAVLLLHAGGHVKGLSRRTGSVLLVLASIMVFATLSRASWLAGLVVLLGLVVLYPGRLKRAMVAAVPVLALLWMTGSAAVMGEMASTRIFSSHSEATALNRLPVALASIRMFEAKPLFGWGYENFDLYDRQFQASVGGLVPEQDHASHNTYLTILAEQGAIGLLLYLGPVVWWLALTPSALRHMPASGFISRRLLLSLWLIVIGFVVVNNFANMLVVFGLGLWWIVLGLIATLVSRYRPGRDWRGRELPPDVVPFRETLMERVGIPPQDRGGAASSTEWDQRSTGREGPR